MDAGTPDISKTNNEQAPGGNFWENGTLYVTK